MRVLFVTPYYLPEEKFGGPPKRIHSISRKLVERGHAVEVITFHSEWPHGYSAKIDGVSVQYLAWLGKELRQIPRELRPAWAAVGRADIVHCYGLYNLLCPLAALICVLRSKPFLLEPMGMFVPRVRSFAVKRLYNAVITSAMSRKAAAVVATSPIEATELRALGDNVRIEIRRNGVDEQLYRDLPPAEVMRHRWQLGSDVIIALYLGRISEKKNLEQLILAFEKAAIPALRLVLAGPLSEPLYETRLRDLISTRNLQARVVLTGPLYGEEHRAALAAADLFVLPSVNENFGNAAAEAVAAGVPVLITETCGIAPLIHHRAGLAVPLGVDNLASGIATMLDDRGLGNQLVAARADVLRELSWGEPVRQTEDLYRRIISETERSK